MVCVACGWKEKTHVTFLSLSHWLTPLPSLPAGQSPVLAELPLNWLQLGQWWVDGERPLHLPSQGELARFRHPDTFNLDLLPMGCAAWDFVKQTSVTVLSGTKCRKPQVGMGARKFLYNLPLTNWETSRVSLGLSEPQFPYLESRDNNHNLFSQGIVRVK